ncbi:hypothetical protein F2P81_006007 [Scophthalmus maximus]|uniref:Uncharacterized protein n=1 Tax=Scophthalmus maximus TaxID=52904 RepID=A0A6A4TB90_SCOMX|nr:hypothetical protein F2P81_006007 [Scophthalmus maximus]
MTDTDMDQLANFLGHDIRIRPVLGMSPTEKLPGNYEEGSSSSSTGDEPSAEETLPPIEGSEIPPTRKRHKPPSADDEVSFGVSAVRPLSKGKATQKRTPWQQTEVQAVERHMKRFITSCVVPAKNDCEKCLRAEPKALKNRDWQTLKSYVHNRITAYKRKVQRN